MDSTPGAAGRGWWNQAWREARVAYPPRHLNLRSTAFQSGRSQFRCAVRDLDLTTLRLIVSVCELGYIARAGERANIVGSAISKRLAQLEDQVGTPLLVRRRHGVVPSA